MAILLAVMSLSPRSAAAFDCTKSYLAVDYVLCSHPLLVEHMQAMQETWEALRKALPEEPRRVLLDEQRQWISAYTRDCGVPGRGRPGDAAITTAFPCVVRAVVDRQRYLADLLSGIDPTSPGRTPSPAPPSRPTAAGPRPAPSPSPPAAASSPRLPANYPADRVIRQPGTRDAAGVMVFPPFPEGTGYWYVYIDGTLDNDAPERVEALLRRHGVPEKPLVVLNSLGGSVSAGIRLGRLLRNLSAGTFIGRLSNDYRTASPGRCYSACTLAYLGGKFRFLIDGSEFGVHRFAFSQPTFRDTDAAQVVSAGIVEHLQAMGTDTALFSLMTTVGTDDIAVVPKADQVRLGVVNNGVIPGAWTLESRGGGGLSLTGRHETIRGIGQVDFWCTNQEITFSPYFSGDLPKAAGRLRQVLIVDGAEIGLDAQALWPLNALGGLIKGAYILPRKVVERLERAERVGFAVAGADRSTVEGFLDLSFSGAKEKIAGLAKSCWK